MRIRLSREPALLPVLLGGLLLLASATANAQLYRYDWNGPAFTSASGTVSTANDVSGYLILQGPVTNLLFGTVTPVAFSFTAGPVTIDDGTPLHAFTVIKLETDASGAVTDTEIQLVEAIDPGSMGGSPFPGDVICVSYCQSGGPNDTVIDRNVLGAVLGEGEAPVTGSYWAVPSLVAPGIPALPWPLLSLGIPIALSVKRRLRR